MTLRDLFSRIMHFQPVDRTPLLAAEVVTGQAERKWCRDEGVPIDRLAADSIPFDGELVTLDFANQPPLPAFHPHTTSEDDRYVISRDIFGSIVKTQA